MSCDRPLIATKRPPQQFLGVRAHYIARLSSHAAGSGDTFCRGSFESSEAGVDTAEGGGLSARATL